MIDRIEELLRPLAEEDEEEQQEDVPALPAAEKAVPVPAPGDGGEAGDGGTGDGDQTAGELWKDGPVWTVRGGPPEMDEARRAAAERTAQAEETPQPVQDGEIVWTGLKRAARGGGLGLTPEGAERSGSGQAGLEGLYRRTVQGLRPAVPALPPEQTERSVRAREPGSAASLAVDELDRAVRRDSRRYDGGMNIF